MAWATYKIRFTVRRRYSYLWCLFLLPCLTACSGAQESLPPIELKQVAAGFKHPVHVEPYPDGSGRWAVVEQKGRIFLVSPGEKPRDRLLDIRDRVDAGGEKGLLSVAFHPDFTLNRKLYVNYTTRDRDLKTVVSEFEAEREGDRVDATKERVLLSFPQPYSNHNGGYIAFGPDGYLYIGNGDGGAGNDPKNAGQQLNTWLGKMLRIDVDHESAGNPYAVPKGNPFVDKPGARPEIYAYGLRNPWRFSWDRKTKDLYVGDVGQNAFEEVDILVAGGNYGWRVMEGNIHTPRIKDVAQGPYMDPIVVYGRKEGVSITGGYVYRGRAIPELQGVYLYADYATGNLWGLRYDGTNVTEKRLLLRTKKNITSFGETEDGEILVVEYGGKVFQIIAAGTE